VTSVGLYERISDDREQTEAGVSRQDADCRRLAATLGWDVTEVYRENDTSAFRRRTVTLPDGTRALRVVRPEFRRMLADLAEGTIDAVIVYDLDRLVRQPRDLEDLIDVCEHTGRPARSVTGNLDLSSDAGVTMARVSAAIANQSSRDTARRVRRAKEDNAANGRWNGGGRRAYGLTADRTATVPAEADAIREAATRILAGEGITRVAADFAARGLPTVNGRPWARNSLRNILLRPAVAGRLTYRGQDVGPAPWPAILDHDTWQAVVANIEARPRQDTTLRHWLSGILLCSYCGGRLRGNGPAYVCQAPRGCNRTWVHREHAEDLVSRSIVRRTVTARNPTTTKAAPPPDDSQLAELAEMWASREISLTEYRAARAKIVERLKAAAPSPVRLPAWARDDLVGGWPTASPLARHSVASALLEAIIVHPSPDRRWRPERLEFRWR
jgi:DNA invertase Pin-like site-specific DNA recombinase